MEIDTDNNSVSLTLMVISTPLRSCRSELSSS